MTAEGRRELARLCAELTDDLPSKLARLGAYMVERMEYANLCALHGDADEARAARRVPAGAAEALTILGIAVRCAQREPDKQYTYVEIGGRTFAVRTYDED